MAITQSSESRTSPISKRRWLKFSVRTLLIGVTVFSIWFGWQWRIVQERKAIRQIVSEHQGFMDNYENIGFDMTTELPPPEIPWIRRVMGDVAFHRIGYVEMTEEQRLRIEKAYPEADFVGEPFSRPLPSLIPNY